MQEPPFKHAGSFLGYLLTLTCLMSLTSACTVRQMSLEALAGSVMGSGRVYACEEDPELVRGAMPFALKTIETLLAELPTHRELLLSAARGFTLYAYAFGSLDADDAEKNNLAQAKEMRGRARGAYLRAWNYGLQALEVVHPGFREMLDKDVSKVLKRLRRECGFRCGGLPLSVLT